MVAPNFSIGVVLFEAVVARAAALFAGQRDFGAWLHEAHHVHKKDAPSGTALFLERAMRGAGYDAPIDVSSTRAELGAAFAREELSHVAIGGGLAPRLARELERLRGFRLERTEIEDR